jgi:hypothetical protein
MHLIGRNPPIAAFVAAGHLAFIVHGGNSRKVSVPPQLGLSAD